MDNFY